MDTLFPIEPAFPEGFTYTPDFLSKEEEQDLLKIISTIELHPFNFHGYTANRKVESFGYDYSFDNRSLSKGHEIPMLFDFLLQNVGRHASIEPAKFKELLVTEYPPGAVINWHRDAPPFDVIAGISLQTDCIFRLRPHDKTKQTRSSILSFPVTRRSLYTMKGPARTDWQHSIAPVKETRYSITLRTLRT